MRRLARALLLAAGCAPVQAPPPGGPPDFERAGREAADLLRELIRIDTINPPPPGSPKPHADETALLRRVRDVLAADGVPSEIYESAPGRGNLVARLRGSGRKKPVLLMAHVDVVGVDRAKWKVDPLSAETRDGFIWGRGAQDDKDDAAVFVQVMRLLARTRTRLSRDVLLMLNADEESSGRFGARFMVERHWDKIACEYVLNEGGRALLRDGRVVQYGFQTAEKIYNDFRVWIRGESGHSSVPLPDNAIYDAARLLAKVEGFRTPVRVTDTVAAMLAGLAESPAHAEWAATMKKAAAGDLPAALRLCENPRFNAQLRSTFVPTVVRGGFRENVLPPDVEVTFNARLLPGDGIDALIRALLAHAGLEGVEIVDADPEAAEAWKRDHPRAKAAVFVTDRGVDAPASPLGTDLHRALEAAARKLSPGAIVVPQMATGATDSRFFRQKGVACYGISPCPVGEEEEATPHHHDERVREESVGFGVRFVWETLLEVGR
jgi:acetylornithine deacetylase/succinyl-diaminopimelate desuccinylase-like protein